MNTSISPANPLDTKRKRATVIAFYLPQYHPIPENDQWWGPGFTEWTNVAQAKSLYPGHCQPNIPGELGFYDLRLPETRLAQATLAQEHGVSAFCYWHYWFGNGKRLLQRPFEEVLASGRPDFPFCLAWANETWAGLLHGAKDRILLEQHYPGVEDYRAHFELVAPAFADKRYLKVSGKPIFLVYKPLLLPDSHLFTNSWQTWAKEKGFPGIHFVGVGEPHWNPSASGFDAMVLNEPRPMIEKLSNTALERIMVKLTGKHILGVYRKLGVPRMYSYADVVRLADFACPTESKVYPVVVPNWDTTPRCGKYGYVFHRSTPELFREYLRNAVNSIQDRAPEERIVFLKSWNEWAEGNYVEPDRKHGRKYLEAIRDCVLEEPETY